MIWLMATAAKLPMGPHCCPTTATMLAVEAVSDCPEYNGPAPDTVSDEPAPQVTRSTSLA